jgi:Fuc2NAc and GlcNAc transferase
MIPFFFLEFLIGAAGGLLVWRQGKRIGVLDVPNERSAHAAPVPRGGGIGFPIALLFTYLLFDPRRLDLALIPFVLAVLSLINDKHRLSVGLRLVMILAAAALVVGLHARPWLAPAAWVNPFPGPWVTLVAAVLIIAAGTNFYNFMDGINGLAGLAAVVSFALLGAFCLLQNRPPEVMLMAFSAAAAAAGFLPFNFPKAKVFMGDVGSIFLGFTFIGMSFVISRGLTEMLFLASFQSLFFIDGAATVAARFFNHEPVFRAHKRHLYQLLVHKRGWSHAQVALIYASTQAVLGAATLLLDRRDPLGVLIAWGMSLAFYASLMISQGLVGTFLKNH